MTVSSSTRLLTALALLAGGLAVVAAPLHAAQADDPAYPYPFDNTDGDETVQLMNVPGWPSSLVTAGARSSFVTESLSGAVAQEYGLTTKDPTKISDQLRQSWTDDEPYGPLNEFGNLGADSLALGDLTGDGELDAAYLVRGTGGGDDQIHLFGSQPDGFPYLASIFLAPGALSLTVTEASQAGIDGAAQPGYIFVRYADQLRAVRFLSADFELREVTVSGEPAGALVDLYHRGTWLDPGQPAEYSAALRQRTIALLVNAGGSPAKLRAQLLSVNAHTDGDYTVDPPVLGTVSLGQLDGSNLHELTAAGTSTWQTGRVRYDWAAPLPNGGGLGILEPGYTLAMTGRTSANRNELRADYTAKEGGVLSSLTDSGGTQCGNDTPVELDVESYHGNSLIGCASIDSIGDADRLIQNIGRIGDTLGGQGPRFFDEKWVTKHSEAVDGNEVLAMPRPRVVLPCVWLTAAAGHTCSTNTNGGFGSDVTETAGNAALLTTVAAGRDTIDGAGFLDRQYQTGDAWLDADASATNDGGYFWWSPFDTSELVTDSAPLLVAPLSPVANKVEVNIPDSPIGNPPVITRSKPMPVAFLAAPPQVGGAGQEGDAPEFASTSGSTSGTTESTSSRVGVHVGMEYEDALSVNGISIEASLENEVSDETTLEKTITTSQAFRGLVDEDVVVYRTVPTIQWRGTVVRSSTGIGVGTKTSIDFPIDGVVTSAASVSSLARSYPDLYGPTGQLAPVLDDMFGHDVGDPGSYLSYGSAGQQVEQYCDGTLTPGGDRQLRALDPLVPVNPFLATPTIPSLPDILVSSSHDVLTGTGNAEGATFSIENSTTNSRVQTTSLDLSITGKGGYITGGVSGGHTWGAGWSSTLADGVEFASFVGHIPSANPALASETYSWRSFLCQKSIGDSIGTPITAWVLNYAVDGYDGSGGMAPLAPLVATGPVESQGTAPGATVLKWKQDSGTVETYGWKIEAIGTHDVRTGEFSYASPKLSNETDPHIHAVPIDQKLLSGQLYRWKVDATDFFGNAVSSDWEYFVTNDEASSPDGPTAITDRVNTVEDKAVTIDAVANDQSPAGGAVTLAVASEPIMGEVTVKDGVLRYDPDRDACGLDAFDYRITDKFGKSSTATDIVKVDCVNDAPVAVNDRVRMPKGENTLRLLAPGPLGNDVDAEHQDLIAKLLGRPSVGRVRLGAAGALLLRLPADRARTGKVKVRYKACDPEGACSIGVITVVLR